MEEAILKFNEQFVYEPVIENGEIKPAKRYALCGMGGSHLAAHLLRGFDRGLPLQVRSDYGLPELSDDEKQDTLFIASSYSGNTEEVVSFMEMAIREKLNVVVITTGGRLLDLTRENNIPYVQIPNTGIQPRTAVGYALIALLKVLGKDNVIESLKPLVDNLDPKTLRAEGEELAEMLTDHIPVIYSSTRNKPLAYNWKIKFNETGKIPAFYNVFPELNHNEMSGFDVIPATRELSSRMRFIFLKDSADNSRIQERMKIMEGLFKNRGLEVISKELVGDTYFERIFKSILIADWTALTLANHYGVDPEKVELIEEFKKAL